MSETREVIIVNCPECCNGHHTNYPARQQPSKAVVKQNNSPSVGTVIAAGVIGGLLAAFIIGALSDD